MHQHQITQFTNHSLTEPFFKLFLSGIRQWIKANIKSPATYSDIDYPIALKKEVLAVIPVDWDTKDLETSVGYNFIISEPRTDLSKARIISNASPGVIRVIIIGY